MLNQIESLESLIDRISETMTNLREERDRMAGEVEVLQGILDEKEKEAAQFVEEREATQQRLSALLEKMRSSCGFCEGSSEEEPGPAISTTGESLEEEPAGDLFQFGKDTHQGDLTDRF